MRAKQVTVRAHCWNSISSASDWWELMKLKKISLINYVKRGKSHESEWKGTMMEDSDESAPHRRGKWRLKSHLPSVVKSQFDLFKKNSEKLLLQFDESETSSLCRLCHTSSVCFNLTPYNDELMLHTFMCVMSFPRDTAPPRFSSQGSIYCLTNVITFNCSTFMGFGARRGRRDGNKFERIFLLPFFLLILSHPKVKLFNLVPDSLMM